MDNNNFTNYFDIEENFRNICDSWTTILDVAGSDWIAPLKKYFYSKGVGKDIKNAVDILDNSLHRFHINNHKISKRSCIFKLKPNLNKKELYSYFLFIYIYSNAHYLWVMKMNYFEMSIWWVSLKFLVGLKQVKLSDEDCFYRGSGGDNV